MPLPPITRFSSLSTNPSQTNNNNGLYTPQLTASQIGAIPAGTKKNGGIWYNLDANRLEAQVNNATIILAAGNGNVSGPVNSTTGNIATFADNTGKVIQDSGIRIGQVPAASQLSRSLTNELTSNDVVNVISNVGYITFNSTGIADGTGTIYVDTLSPIHFSTQSFSTETQVCSVFSDGLPSIPTSPAALVELQTNSGALLLSRLTAAQISILPMISGIGGTNGMLLFNTDDHIFNGYDGTSWRKFALFNADGTLDLNSHNIINLLDPTSAQQAATKNYVDTRRLDQFVAPISSINLNSQKIINLATPIISTDAANKGYVDSGFGPNTLTYIVQTANLSLLPNAQSLGSLTTGLLKNTTTGSTGVLSIGTPGIDYYSPGFPTTILENTINFFIGTGTGNTSLSGTQNTGVGTGVLPSLTFGTENSSFGFQSSQRNIIGNFNCSFGYRALFSNLADSNSAFGTQSLANNTNGTNNSSFGYQSLLGNSTGSFNCAFGPRTLLNNIFSNNSAFGYLALQNNGVGGGAGPDNVAVGYQAGANQNAYTRCIFIGSGSDAGVNNLTNAVAIGYNASVGATNCMVLGGNGANQLSVGIGITPNAQLQLPTIHVKRKLVLFETANNDNQVFGFGTASGAFTFQIDSTGSNYIFQAAMSSSASNELMRITGAGNLLVGQTAAEARIVANGGVQNVSGEDSCIRVNSTSNAAKIELKSATTNGHIWETRSTNVGNYEITDRTATATRLSIDNVGTTYIKQSYAYYYSGASANTVIISGGLFQPITWGTATSTVLNNYAITGSGSTTAVNFTGTANNLPIPQLVQFSLTATNNAPSGTVGEITTFYIAQTSGGVTFTQSIIRTTLQGATATTGQILPLNSVSASRITTVLNGDKFQICVSHPVTGRTITITDFNFTISST